MTDETKEFMSSRFDDGLPSEAMYALARAINLEIAHPSRVDNNLIYGNNRYFESLPDIGPVRAQQIIDAYKGKPATTPDTSYEVNDLYTWLGIDGDPVGPALGELRN